MPKEVNIGEGTAHIGAVSGHSGIVDVTLTLDTSAYAAGDVLADTQVITGALRIADGTGVLQSLMVVDKDDQTAAQMDLYFFDANVTLGTENAAPSISDANAASLLGIVTVDAADWKDVGGAKVASKTGLGLVVKAATGTANIYVAAVTQGTPTQTASGIVARFGLLRD